MIPGTPTDADLARLTEDELDQLLSDLEDIAGGESLRDFMVRMAPHHPPPKHLDVLLAVLEQARYTRDLKVGISMPPGHAKTHLFLNAFAWWLSKFPADTCAYNSYNAAQALGKSAVARALAETAGVTLSEDTNAKSEWRTTNGGGLIAGGMESLTGKRVQGPLVIDDPYAGPADAFSPAYREQVFNDLQMVAMTRREGGAPLFLIHTRWHPDDAIGRMKRLQREGKIRGWTFVNLPAIDEDGAALWPEMYPIDRLNAFREDIGEFAFAALYQGEPRPRGGSVFGEPRYYDPATTSFEGCRIVIAADPAASIKTSADYSAAVVLAMRGHGAETTGYVRHVYRRQVSVPQFAADLLSLQATWGNAMIHVESVGGFKAVAQILRQLKPGIRVTEIVPRGDKFLRAQRAAAAWNSDPPRLMVPERAPWLGAFLDELAVFTGVGDAHDDQVDALAHAWNAGPVLTMFDPAVVYGDEAE